jgi:ABC-type polysaccharide/polyol phosphate export permease
LQSSKNNKNRSEINDKDAKSFYVELYELRHLIFELVKRDFKSRFTGSYLGLMWTILQPLLMMLIMWFVFGHGLKVGGGSGIDSFVPYMFSAQVAWLFFSESFMTGTNAVVDYSFLVKKVNFRLSILPLVKICSALIIHLIFIFIVVALNWASGVAPSIYILQIPFYTSALCILLLGLTWLTSGLNVFVRDTANVVAILLQFGFWLTPIFWNPSTLPPGWQKVISFNPLTYVVTGYRDSLLYQRTIFENGGISAVIFWVSTIVIFFVGIHFFKKLRPHFADVV